MAPHAIKNRKMVNSESEDRPSGGKNSDPVLEEPGAENTSLLHKRSALKPDPPAPSINQALDMYHVDIFQMQITELLQDMKPRLERRLTEAERTLRKIKDFIEALPCRSPVSPTEAARALWEEEKVAIPFPEPKPSSETKYTLAFAKPLNIDVVGSFALRTAVFGRNEPAMVDMAITMPSELFQNKDYLSYRYFHKRAYYIACIAAGLQKSCDSSLTLRFNYQNGSRLQPVLLVSPQGGHDASAKNPRYVIRIILAVDREVFAITKTLPWKNCIRQKDSNNLSKAQVFPTPFYNATIRAEASISEYLKLLHRTSTHSNSFQGACTLASTWLRQRGFGSDVHLGGFGSFESASLMSLLMQGGGPKGRPLLSIGYSSYQLFKALLQFLHSRDIVQEPMVLGWNDTIDPGLLTSMSPIFFDGSRGLNVLYKMTPWSYKKLRHEAVLTLEALNAPVFDKFIPCFITKVNERIQQSDISVRIPMKPLFELAPIDNDGNDRYGVYSKKIYSILSTALGDRVSLIYPQAPCPVPWALNASNNPFGESSITVDLLVRPEHTDRSVDRGPPAEEKKAAAAFREFWGDKAELRRFQDGSILESVSWIYPASGPSIIQQIIAYSCQRHLGQAVEHIGEDFEQQLPGHHGHHLSSKAPFQVSWQAFEQLSSDIRALEGLPLQIRQISAACSELRAASITLQTASALRYHTPMDLIIQFEGSARWPDGMAAIQHTKIAFLLKLSSLLTEARPSYACRLGLENTSEPLLNNAFLDAISPIASFRLRIHHDRELTLLERSLKQATTSRIRESSARAIAAYKRTFIHSPTHTAMLRNLATRHKLLSPTIRLLKQWCASHLLSPYLPAEVIELVAIRMFVSPYPYTPPGSLRTGFVRTLNFIAKWDWWSEPLIVDTDGEMSAEEAKAINTRFEGWRKVDPALNRTVLFAASTIDHTGVAWTWQGPPKVVAARLSALARAAMERVSEGGIDLDPGALFVHSMTDYDFVLHIKPQFCGGHEEGVKNSAYKNLQLETERNDNLVGYDPVQLFLDELEGIYGGNILFFHDGSVKAVVAGVWNPSTGRRGWKVNLGYSTEPDSHEGAVEEDAMVSINKSSILSDIARLGGDLISEIVVKGQ